MLDTVLNDLKNDNVVSLDLKFKELGDSVVSQILKLSEGSSVLKSLNLTDNDISAEGSVKLSEFLKKNTSLTELILDLNPLSISKLSLGLAQNTTVRRLHLGFQNPTIQDFRALFTALNENDSISNLGLSDVGLNVNSAALLGRYIRSTTALCGLYIARNLLSDMALHHVVSSLRFNTTLVELNLNRVHLDAVSINAMERDCQNSYNLSRLYTSQNVRNIQLCTKRNRLVAQKISEVVTPITSGVEYQKSVYGLDITFWELSTLFKGGFSAVNYCHQIDDKRKFNLERLFGYLFIRDYVLSDIADEKLKRAKYLLIIRREINAAPGDHSDRHLLNVMAHCVASDRNAKVKLAFMINPVVKREFFSEQISKIVNSLNGDEIKFILSNASKLEQILQQVKEMKMGVDENRRLSSRALSDEEKVCTNLARKIALSLSATPSIAIN